jgi:hypothetical protein
MTLPLHPATGVHYAQAIPSGWGPFSDIRAIYDRFATRCPWLTVYEPAAIPPEMWAEPRAVVCAWDRHASPPGARQAKWARVYAEAIGEPSLMLPAHRAELAEAQTGGASGRCDALFCHTPWMAEQLGRLTARPAYVLPVGWDEPIMGMPRFGSAKGTDCLWYGSSVGKRALVMPYLQQRLGEQLVDASGMFGRVLLAHLDRAKASLYVAHSDVQSYSTWRIWQTVSTSAALITEPGDFWPLDVTRHAVAIPRIDWLNAAPVADEIGRILREVDLLAVARRAHEEIARHYTVERVINEFMVPAGAQIVGV